MIINLLQFILSQELKLNYIKRFQNNEASNNFVGKKEKEVPLRLHVPYNRIDVTNA